MKKSIQGLYLASLALLGVLATALRTAALFTGYDFVSGYFTKKLINNISIVILISAIVLFATFLIYKKNFRPRVDIGSPKDFVGSACIGVALIVMAFEVLLSSKNISNTPTSNIERIVTSGCALLAAAAVFYFLFSILFRNGAPKLQGLFSMATAMFLTFYALMLYFNKVSPLNSPAKLCDQMAYMASALFFIYETRLTLRRPMWKMYVVSGLWATVLTAYSSIPSLIVYIVRGSVISHTISENVLALAIFVFCLIRVISALTAEDDCENSMVSMVKTMHKERIAELEEARVARAQYINNEENGEDENDNYEIELPATSKNDGAEENDK